MGKSKKTTVGYHFRVAYHVGLCRGPIDAFLEFRAADKVAWDGSQQYINWIWPDDDRAKVPKDEIREEVIPPTGSLTSSQRIYIGAPDLFGGENEQGGIVGPVDVMFGGADQLPNPYLQSVFGMQTVAWRGLATLAFCGGRFGAMSPMPQRPAYKVRKIINGWSSGECWYPAFAQVPVGSTTINAPTALYIALDVSGSMAGGRLEVLKQAMGFVFDVLAGWVTAGSPQIDLRVVAWGSSATHRDARPLTLDGIGEMRSFVNGLTTSGSTNAMAAYGGVHEFAELSGLGNRVVVCVSDGGMSNIDQAVQLIADSEAALGPIAMRGIGIATPGSLANFDNSGGPIPVISGENADEAAQVILAAMSSTSPLLGMNPAHLLVYSRTDESMGREPLANINQASLQAGALRLFAEGFGVCTHYDPAAESPEDLEERICRLIGGSFQRSLSDGQWYLDLARGDYNVDALPVIDDDDILDFREQPTTLERAVNSIAVRYFDPTRKETIITPAVRALGLVRQFGEIHETLDCPEIPSASLALRKAETELRARITPTRTFELTTTPRSKHLRRNQYFLLRSSRRQIDGMVCIVGERVLGTLKSGAIRWKVAQDVYRLAADSYAAVEPGVDTRPPVVPAQITASRVFEVPYINIAALMPRAELDALTADAAFVGAFAAEPASGTNYTMCVRADEGEYAAVAIGEWCPTATTAEAVDADTSPAIVTLATRSSTFPVSIGMVVMWGSEICRVDAVDAEAGTLALARGCADTVPQAHAAGDRLWLATEAAIAETEYVEGEDIEVKLLTNTGSRQAPLSGAATIPLQFAGRASRPYPPGRFRIGLDESPLAGEFVVSWAHRDRVLQADQLVDTTAVSIGPERTTRYGMRILRASNNAVLVQREDIAGTAAQVNLTLTGDIVIELWSISQFGASLQRHRRVVAYTAAGATQNVIAAPEYSAAEDEYVLDGGAP
ncbi:hypothetical protein CMZ84_04200 [Lysobacteraceae bacterium NML93-0399]|nr:hypothetical protein CMZ84_04200 [Xanthomonadaceae bacterium NML93-0399]